MGENPFAAPQAAETAGNDDAADLKAVMKPLLEGKGWIRFLGVASCILGGFYILGGVANIVGGAMNGGVAEIVGGLFNIAISAVPIWLGLSLYKAGGLIATGVPRGDVQEITEANKGLKTATRIMGVVLVLNLVISVLVIVAIIAAIVLGAAAASG